LAQAPAPEYSVSRQVAPARRTQNLKCLFARLWRAFVAYAPPRSSSWPVSSLSWQWSLPEFRPSRKKWIQVGQLTAAIPADSVSPPLPKLTAPPSPVSILSGPTIHTRWIHGFRAATQRPLKRLLSYSTVCSISPRLSTRSSPSILLPAR